MKKIFKIFAFFSLLIFSDSSFATIFIASSSATNCSNCDGTATITTDITGNITYTWYTSNNVPIYSESNSLGISYLANLCTGIYYVITSYENNIDSTTYFSIDTDITNNFDALDMTICSSTLTLDLNYYIPGNIDPTGTWITPENNESNGLLNGDLNTPITSGIYQYILLEGPCEVITGINLTVNAPANPGLSTTYIICENYPPFLMINFLSGNPDLGGNWFDSNNTPTNEIYDTNTQDTELFTYIIDTVEGCSPVFSTLYVIEKTLPDAGTSNEITICETAPTLDLFSSLLGNPDTLGTWFNENLQTIQNPFDPSLNPSGIYTYMVAGEIPCPSVQSQLTINYTPGVYSGTENDTTLCDSFSTFNLFELLTNTVSPGGTWTNDDGLPIDSLITITPTNEGTYNYAVSLAGCSEQNSNVTVIIETPLEAGFDTTLYLCETTATYDLMNALSSNATPNGLWYENNNPINPSIDDLSIGLHEFQYQTNTVSCPQDTAYINIQVDEYLNSESDSSIVLCQSSPTILLDNYLNDSTNNFGNWFFNNEMVSSFFNPDSSSPGEYTCVLNSQNSCPISTMTLTIQVMDSITFPNNLTIERCNHLQEIAIGEPSEPTYNYQWTPENILSADNISNPVIDLSSISPLSTLIFTINITNGICQKTVQREIIIHETPNILLDNLYSGCQGEVISLDAGMYAQTLWSPQNLFSNPQNANQTITLNTSIIINLSVIDENNCEASKDIELNVLPTPSISFEINQESQCTPSTIEIRNTSSNNMPTEYIWNFSNGYQSTNEIITFYLEQPTSFNFSLSGISENGCTNSSFQESNITIYQTPVSSFTIVEKNLSIFNNQVNLNNTSQYATQYQWTLEDEFFSNQESPIFNLPQNEGTNNLVCLQVFNSICTDTSCQNIYIPFEQNIYVPNSFTPNGDEINDVFKPILSNKNILQYTFKIYNRWGEVIFETHDLTKGWIGDTNTNHSYYAKDGVYIWVIKIKEKNILGEQTFKGKVTVIR